MDREREREQRERERERDGVGREKEPEARHIEGEVRAEGGGGEPGSKLQAAAKIFLFCGSYIVYCARSF